MEEKSIKVIEPDHIKMAENSKNAINYRGCYIYHLDNSSPHSKEAFNYPYRINAFFILICKRGYGKISVNLSEHEIHDNTIFVNTPNNIIQLQQQDRKPTEGVVLSFSEEFAREANFDVKNLTPLFLKLKDKPIIGISPEECDRLLGIISSLGEDILSDPSNQPFREDTIRSLTSYLLYKICGVISLGLKQLPVAETKTQSRNEEYFHRFMKVLGENYKRERTLGFYSSQLYISPKYLTTIIRKVSSRSAADWINSYVILEAKNLLRYSSMSVQEVAYALNFPNQSFFGKYFKHHTGYSPSQYKMLK